MNKSPVYGNVLVHGIDVVDTVHISRLFNTLAATYLDRFFTENEILSAGIGCRRLEKLASRFAIKEATLKALGTGWGNGVSFKDVEVFQGPLGAPSIQLHRKLQKIAEDLGIGCWVISASHAGSITMASVIGLAK